jgi:aryl-alcohol dehydrogenase-like predicted oxidoreductase
MRYRTLGRTGYRVSEISFGTWAIGGFWGQVSDDESMAALHAALDAGVNFFDTADVYGDGRSERLLARLKQERHNDEIIIATKAGRKLPKQTVEGYSPENLRAWVDASLQRLEAESLDLLQLHCPPTDAYYHPEIFGTLDDLVQQGKLRHYGVSVERVEEALKAIESPGVKTVQIIFNCFRQRPAELFFEQAQKRNVGILARVPLASGLLTGKLTASSVFAADDHRTFNRNGERFDMGETFSGVPYDVAIEAVEAIRAVLPPNTPMTQFALKWILMHPAITCAIPGGKKASQVKENCEASNLPPLTPETMAAVASIYEKQIAPYVHYRW